MRDDFINIVKQRAIELGGTPKQRDFGNNNNLPSASTIRKNLNLKTWNEVLQLCEVGKTRERNYNEKDALLKLKNYINELEYVPLRDELKNLNLSPSVTWFGNKFGSYEKTLQLIGCRVITTDEDLLNILKDFYIKNGKSPTSKDMTNANRVPSVATYYTRFNTKSWNTILTLAGLELNNFQGYTKENVLNKLKDYCNTYGKVLSREEYIQHNLTPSIDWYYEYLGTYNNACYLAGLIDKPLTNEERVSISIEELIKLTIQLNRFPSIEEYENIKHKGFSRIVLERKLKSKYSDICKKYVPQSELYHAYGEITQKELIEAIYVLNNKIGRPPMYYEFKNFGYKYSYNTFQRIFNGMSYNNIIESLGLTPSGSTSLIKDEETLLAEFYDYFKELGRIPYNNELNNCLKTASSTTYCKYFGTIKNVCDILNIDYELYYKDLGYMRIYLDKKGEICRSLIEQCITNFLIDNNIKYEKETYYSELIGFMGKKRFDWKIYIGNKIYYVEYFGLFSKNPKRSIDKKYLQRTKYKIKKLYQYGHLDKCLFIFPNDIKTKSLEEIFLKIGVKTVNKVA